MQATGELKKDKILITKPKQVGRFYNKSHLGKITKQNHLELNLIEGLFLLDEQKLKIYQNKKEISFQNLLIKAAKKISNLEIKYTIFKDLRKRGHIIKIFEEEKEFNFYIPEKNTKKEDCLISVFYERKNITIKKIKELINKGLKKQAKIWFAIVDEEGDITYYDVKEKKLSGETKNLKYKKTRALLLKNIVVIDDSEIANLLFNKEFFGKPFGETIQLSLIETLYLIDKNIIELRNLNGKKVTKEELKNILKISQPDINNVIKVFKDLKKNGLIIKTGFKFGTHFRAYTKKPGEIHAEYLIHVVDKDYKVLWAEISRAVRLAHSVNKEIVFARFVNNNKIEYICFNRLRP